MNEDRAQKVRTAIANAAGGASEWVKVGSLVLTSGVRDVCEAAQSYWLMDIIHSYQHDKRVKKDKMLQEMQFWKLAVNLEKKTAVVTLERDTNDVVLTQVIEYTDFPIDSFRVYYSPADRIVLLPNEY